MSPPAFPPTAHGPSAGPPADAGCEPFAQAAMLRVDRELGPAESAALDAHLAVCPVCRRRADQAHALSAMLRHWDTEGNGPVHAPSRLKLAIVAAAAEQGRSRRVEARRVWVSRLATAASIVLVLGAGLLFGLLVDRTTPGLDSATAGAGTDPAAGTDLAADPSVSPAVPVPPALVSPMQGEHALASLGPAEVVPSRLRDIPSGATSRPDTWLSASEWMSVRGTIVRLHDRYEQRIAFEEAHGGEWALWWTDPASGRDRLITVRAYVGRHRGEAGPSGDAGGLAAAGSPESHTIVDESPPVDTGRRVAHYLRLPRHRDRLEEALAHPPIKLKSAARADAPEDSDPTATITVGEVFLLRRGPHPRASRDGAIGPVVGDLQRAVNDGHVTLHEGTDDDLVAFVHDLPWPLFAPAGELVAGGRTDRVLLRGLWIPAGRGERRVIVRCAAAGTGGASHGATPVPTGMVAGPALRALLAQGADGDEVRAWISKRVPILDRYGRDYSLLAFYAQRTHDRNMTFFTSYLLRNHARGFAVSDARGGFVGVEITDLPEDAAASLLARLIEGYAAEAGMDRIRHVDSGEDPDVGARANRPTVVALLDLLGSEETFRSRDRTSSGTRLLRMVEPNTRLRVEVVEDASSHDPVLASALAP